MKKNHISATVNPGWEWGEGGRRSWLCCQGCHTAFGRQTVLVYYRQKQSACIYVFQGSKKQFCMCVSKMEEQVSRNCTSAFLNSCIWFGVSSVRVRSSELRRGWRMNADQCFMCLMQVLFCVFNPYAVVKIQFPPLSCTSKLPCSTVNLCLLFGNVSGLLVASLYLGTRNTQFGFYLRNLVCCSDGCC